MGYDAQYHRRRAEELLDQVTETDGLLARYAGSDEVIAAAQAHATLFLALQFATEFDPRSTLAALEPSRPTPLDIPPRLDARRRRPGPA